VKQGEFAQLAGRRLEEEASGCLKALPSTMDKELEEILK
jgi:hypothetical protein